MGRIADDEIERLKKEISVEALARARGVVLVKRGADLVGLCPFHDDREPSLVITPERNLWHCLGACQAGGDAIAWVMRSEGLSFRHAIEVLRRETPRAIAVTAPAPASSAAPPKRTMKRKLEALAPRDAADTEVLERVVDHYHATLMESPEAIRYLELRGLKHPEVIERFRLGYANRTLGYRLPHARTSEGAALRGRLEALGVYRASGHEHLTGSLVIPLFDADGRVVQLYGRKIRDDLREGTPKHLYLSGPHRGVFNREGLAGAEDVIVCEALIDALTFWVAGYAHVTSSYGVEVVPDELVEAIATSGAKRARIAFDRDEAGDRGAEKLAARLEAHGLETYRVRLPKGMDANLYARKVVPATESLGLVLRQAEWMGRGAAPTEGAPAIPAIGTAIEAAPLEPVIFQKEDLEERRAEEAPGVLPSLVASSSSAVASPATSAAAARAGEAQYTFGDRRWRVRGLGKADKLGELRVNVMVRRERDGGEHGGFFVDTVELYAARHRAAFVKAAATELELDERVVTQDLGRILLDLEARRDAELEAALAPKETTPAMSEAEREEAMALLRDPRLCERIAEDLGRAGLVGEYDNKLVAYLAATSRKLEEPLAVVIQSSSAAGKSSLMDAVLSLMPEEERVQYSAMTGQSLFYMSGQDLKHKVLAIVEEEGAERASYALKLLQSEGELTIASTGKDPATGRLVTQTYRVEGPCGIMLTTTAIEVDEELMNRCLVLTVDEGREQTRAIHERQQRARMIEGRVEGATRARIRRTHQNAQRLLRPVFVSNPFAMELRFPDHVTRTRRDLPKYLTLISAVALLHQHQREVKSFACGDERIEYIEATAEDVATATRLTHAVLGRSFDELPPQTRKVLGEIELLVRERMAADGVSRELVRFSRREVRERVSCSHEQVRVHLGRLCELEYVIARRGRAGQGYEYELVYRGEDEDGGRYLVGLGRAADAATTGNLQGAKGNLQGQNENQQGRFRAETGPFQGGYRGRESPPKPIESGRNGVSKHLDAETALLGAAARRALS